MSSVWIFNPRKSGLNSIGKKTRCEALRCPSCCQYACRGGGATVQRVFTLDDGEPSATVKARVVRACIGQRECFAGLPQVYHSQIPPPKRIKHFCADKLSPTLLTPRALVACPLPSRYLIFVSSTSRDMPYCHCGGRLIKKIISGTKKELKNIVFSNSVILNLPIGIDVQPRCRQTKHGATKPIGNSNGTIIRPWQRSAV